MSARRRPSVVSWGLTYHRDPLSSEECLRLSFVYLCVCVEMVFVIVWKLVNRLSLRPSKPLERAR